MLEITGIDITPIAFAPKKWRWGGSSIEPGNKVVPVDINRPGASFFLHVEYTFKDLYGKRHASSVLWNGEKFINYQRMLHYSEEYYDCLSDNTRNSLMDELAKVAG